MNATVERIVNLLFEDVVMTDETEAIRDEVMNNCQERFAALLQDGYSEDDAIGAVIESLKGMDEVLQSYPHKNAQDNNEAFAKDTRSETPSGACRIDWQRVSDLRISVKSADVEILETDGEPELVLENGGNSHLEARIEGMTLVITQEQGAVETSNERRRSGFLAMLPPILDRIVQFSFDDGCRATLRLPAGLMQAARVQSLSGSIRMRVPCETIDLQSASGDVDLNLNSGADFHLEINGRTWDQQRVEGFCRSLTAKSISGDVDVAGRFGMVSLSSTSGDVDFSGAAEKLELSTVSGDGTAELGGDWLKASTVSGDLDVTLACGDSAAVELSTVSGDIELELPEHVAQASVKMSTRTGDVEYHNIGLYDDAPVKVKCSSVSGDISIGR